MKNRIMKTFSAKATEIDQNWLIIDAEGQTLGRMATAIASRLRGKHKAEFTPHLDTGDYVVVVNADKVHVTGNKAKDKMYYSHSGYPGGLKSVPFEKLIVKSPEKVIKLAVKGMLPKTPLGRSMFKKLKVYAGAKHPHEAQQPQALQL
jgi:large subunit ribosomal protein L13